LIDRQQTLGPTIQNALLLGAKQTDQTAILLKFVSQKRQQILPTKVEVIAWFLG
jgi:hypothetical protein